jgi:hypothetical protein
MRNTSKEVLDYDCIYRNLIRRYGCTVGRKYITVGKEQNLYAGMYTYMLGCNASSSELSLTELAEDIEKVQKMCVHLYNKLEGKK